MVLRGQKLQEKRGGGEALALDEGLGVPGVLLKTIQFNYLGNRRVTSTGGSKGSPMRETSLVWW